jgi:hypothetical protein
LIIPPHRNNHRGQTFQIHILDIKMLAKNKFIFQDASETLYNLNSDKTIRAQCRARKDYNRQQNAIKY